MKTYLIVIVSLIASKQTGRGFFNRACGNSMVFGRKSAKTMFGVKTSTGNHGSTQVYALWVVTHWAQFSDVRNGWDASKFVNSLLVKDYESFLERNGWHISKAVRSIFACYVITEQPSWIYGF